MNKKCMLVIVTLGSMTNSNCMFKTTIAKQAFRTFSTEVKNNRTHLERTKNRFLTGLTIGTIVGIPTGYSTAHDFNKEKIRQELLENWNKTLDKLKISALDLNKIDETISTTDEKQTKNIDRTK